jgi:hypothetical protein
MVSRSPGRCRGSGSRPDRHRSTPREWPRRTASPGLRIPCEWRTLIDRVAGADNNVEMTWDQARAWLQHQVDRGWWVSFVVSADTDYGFASTARAAPRSPPLLTSITIALETRHGEVSIPRHLVEEISVEAEWPDALVISLRGGGELTIEWEPPMPTIDELRR